MDAIERLLIEDQCRKLMLHYARHIDHLDPEAFAGLFAEDAVYKPAMEPEPLRGRAAILEWARRYPKTRRGRHLSTNQLVEVIDAESARGTSYAVVYHEDAPQPGVPSAMVAPRSVVEYIDTYRRTSEGWRIATRHYERQFQRQD